MRRLANGFLETRFCAHAQSWKRRSYSCDAKITSEFLGGGACRNPEAGLLWRSGSRRLLFKEMFSFFRKAQDPKKVLETEKEADGFVLLGNTFNEERNESKDKTSLSIPGHEQISQANKSKLTESGTEVGTEKMNVESTSSMLELLSDVPFTLAPHVLAVQTTCNDIPRQLLSYDVSDNLTKFWYDFTLENSVLCES